jgi:hypothetical protein
MAIIRTAPLIGAISGNLGGVCFVQSKSGPVIRTRNRRLKQNDKRHYQIRALFQQLRNAWRNLTDNQRTAWRQATISVPNTNRLGLTSTISGYQLFIKTNAWGNYVAPIDPILILKAPSNLNRRTPWLLDSFTITSGGAKGLILLPPAGGGFPFAQVYGARTFSTAPRRSWFSFRQTEVSGAPPGTITLLKWDDDIGDPQPGEQCWIQLWFQQRSAPDFITLPTGPIIASTFAL